MQNATIGGELVQISDFSAFKALKAMDIVGEIEGEVRELMNDAADFRREYGERNVMVLSRAEARRQFRAAPLYKHHEDDDGKVRAEPVVIDGAPVMGADPLGHLTNDDWEASGNVLRLPEEPSDDAMQMALLPKAFKRARVAALRLIALAVVSNADLERWDGSADIDEELDREVATLLHRAAADELIGLAVVVMNACQEQLRGPFEEAIAAAKTMFGRSSTEEKIEERVPMTLVETDASSDDSDSTAGQPTSSTGSPAATDGDQPRSSTEPASGSSSS